jgi:GMP synthase (glutamine-hydrolysing)
MSANVILLRHDDGPEDDRVATFMNSNGIAARSVRPFAGESLPSDRSDVAGCVIFGGLFDAFDTDVHAFLGDQYAFVDRCLKWNVPMLGLCLGAQQIAHHLGAHVGPPESNVHEFGYYEIRPSPGANDFLTRPLHVAQSHWHGLDLPSGATLLASSDLFPNQAFRFGENVYGFQFHAEMTPSGFARMQNGSSRYGLPGVQSKEEQLRLQQLHDEHQAAWFVRFLETLFTTAQSTRMIESAEQSRISHGAS